MTQANFEDLKTTQKGRVGEEEIDKYLLSIGIVPYSPATGRAHPFDRLCATRDKQQIFIAESKAKARRTFYPDTGINLSNYDDYIRIRDSYGIDVWIFFVDESIGEVYGNRLSILDQDRVIRHKGKPITYPWNQRDKRTGKMVRYFPLSAMKKIADIDDKVIDVLKGLSTRNYDYHSVE